MTKRKLLFFLKKHNFPVSKWNRSRKVKGWGCWSEGYEIEETKDGSLEVGWYSNQDRESGVRGELAELRNKLDEDRIWNFFRAKGRGFVLVIAGE